MMRRSALISVAFVLAALFAATYGQFGESAGALNFNVSLGGSETLNYTLFNQGNSSIGFGIVFQGFNPIKNTTMPTVIISPMNGTIGPHQNIRISTTVEMPDDQHNLNARWDGLIQAVEQQAGKAGQNGAVIFAGLGKEIIITAQPAKGIPLIYIGVAVVVVAAAAAGGALYYRSRKRKAPARARAPAPRKITARRAAAGRKAPARKAAARKRAPQRRKRAPARRRAAPAKARRRATARKKATASKARARRAR